jgi:hypothetical protein
MRTINELRVTFQFGVAAAEAQFISAASPAILESAVPGR